MIWRVKIVACDGNQLGKVWQEWFFNSKELAEIFLKDKIKTENNEELKRNRNFALYKKDLVEGISGYCNWQYGTMLLLDEIKIID